MEMIKILRLVMVRRFFSSLFSIWCFFCSVSVCFFHLFYIFFCSAALQSFRCSTLYALAFRTNQERFNQFCPSRNRKPHVSYASAIYRPLSPNLPFHFLLMDIRFCFFLSVCIFNLNSLSQALPVYFIYLFNIFFIHSNCIVDVCISVWVCMSMCLCEFSFARLIVFSFVSECYIFFLLLVIAAYSSLEWAFTFVLMHVWIVNAPGLSFEYTCFMVSVLYVTIFFVASYRPEFICYFIAAGHPSLYILYIWRTHWMRLRDPDRKRESEREQENESSDSISELFPSCVFLSFVHSFVRSLVGWFFLCI